MQTHTHTHTRSQYTYTRIQTQTNLVTIETKVHPWDIATENSKSDAKEVKLEPAHAGLLADVRQEQVKGG